jgi:hypothetical protein
MVRDFTDDERVRFQIDDNKPTCPEFNAGRKLIQATPMRSPTPTFTPNATLTAAATQGTILPTTTPMPSSTSTDVPRDNRQAPASY